MRFLLLTISTVISVGIGFLAYLFLSGQITEIMYALISLAISIGMTFTATHFMYQTYRGSRDKKRLSKEVEAKDKQVQEKDTQLAKQEEAHRTALATACTDVNQTPAE